MHLVRACPILGHQQPPGQASFDDVIARAPRRLGELRHAHEEVPVEKPAQRGAGAELVAERDGSHALRRSPALDERLERRDVDP